MYIWQYAVNMLKKKKKMNILLSLFLTTHVIRKVIAQFGPRKRTENYLILVRHGNM